jgi:hypothetical protein
MLWQFLLLKMGKHSFILCLTKGFILFMYSHLVKVVKFLMPPRNHCVSGNDVICELLEGVLQSINEIVACLKVDD